jgi:hypothetical protein
MIENAPGPIKPFVAQIEILPTNHCLKLNQEADYGMVPTVAYYKELGIDIVG